MKKKFVGFYDYTVILTLMSLVLAIWGMTRAMQDHFRLAVFLLAMCGLLDTFDGKVARTKKNRTDDEKLYGIQLDSLVDMVSFGVFPAMLCFLMGMRTTLDVIILVVYAICGVIRLSYFNVLETNRQMHPNGEEKIYHGLPITSIAVILPLTFLASFAIDVWNFVSVLRVIMLLTAFLFVFNFKVKKLTNWQLFTLLILALLAAAAILFFSRYKLPKNVAPEEPWIELDGIEDLIEEPLY